MSKGQKAKARKVCHFLFLSYFFFIFGFMTKGKKDYTPTGPPNFSRANRIKCKNVLKLTIKRIFYVYVMGERTAEDKGYRLNFLKCRTTLKLVMHFLCRLKGPNKRKNKHEHKRNQRNKASKVLFICHLICLSLFAA